MKIIEITVDGKPAKAMTLTLTPEAADELSGAISDILCWADGFAAARAGTELEGRSGPMGLAEIRELNIKLKRALRAPNTLLKGEPYR